jgi:mono/diheme cytochrome c family protein
MEVLLRRAMMVTLLQVGAALALPMGGMAQAALADATVRSAASPAQSQSDDSAPLFYRDVLPILQANCQSCHKAEGTSSDGGLGSGFHAADLVAPMSLETYEQARPWAPLIADAVEERRMPPWSAHPQHYGTFADERYLTTDEISTLVTWAQSGAPAGDPSDAPPARVQERVEIGWAIGEPDLIVQVSEPFRLEEDWVDVYVDLHVPLEGIHTEHRWIKASQIAPGSSAVHHINSPYLGTVAPGRGPNVWPKGFGILLPAGETLVFDSHYHKPAGEVIEDQSGGAFVFYEEGEVVTHMVETFTSFPGGANFVIPAGDPHFSHTAYYTFEEDTYLLSVAPHAHFRGKASRMDVEYPDGTFELLLHIPRYHFAWQHKYDWIEPFLMPAGSKLHLTFWWDNSADNPYNPDPTRNVPFGLPSHDEMMTGRVFYAKAAPIHHVVGDPIPEEFFPGRSDADRTVHGVPTHISTGEGSNVRPER